MEAFALQSFKEKRKICQCNFMRHKIFPDEKPSKNAINLDLEDGEEMTSKNISP